MKKTFVILTVIILAMGTMALSFAGSRFSPAEIYADLTGTTEEAAYALKLETGKTFGELAEEAGVYDAFREATHANKVAWINEKVANGELTEEEAAQIIENLENCTGDRAQSGMMRGLFGRNGSGRGCDGTGLGNGNGQGTVNGRGTGLRNGGGMGRGFGN